MDYDVEIIQNQYHPIDRVNNLISMDEYPDDWIIVNDEPLDDSNLIESLQKQQSILCDFRSNDLFIHINQTPSQFQSHLFTDVDIVSTMLNFLLTGIYAMRKL